MEATDKVTKKGRYTAAEEEKRLELLPILIVYVNKYINKGKEAEYYKLIENINKDKEIKFSFLKDIFNYYFKLTPEAFRGETY